MLAAQVEQDPLALPVLDVFDRELDGFAAAETTADQQGQDETVAFPFERCRVGGVQ